MHFSLPAIVILAAVLAAPIFSSAQNLKPIEKYPGEKTGKYIVTLKESSSSSAWIERLRLSAGVTSYTNVINGFAADLTEAHLNLLRVAPDVEMISEDGIARAFTPTKRAPVIQSNAPWGLQRIAQPDALSIGSNPNTLNYEYTYDSAAGSGVDIYVVDTGININHVDFGGRAVHGFSFPGLGNTDDNGHGTHCASTAAGTQFGVAKGAKLTAVKVLDANGAGSFAGVIAGLDWVLVKTMMTYRPSVVSMSLGGGTSAPLDVAVRKLISSGIHVAVAAGNSNANAENTSPARVEQAITVGASTITDSRAWFSNFGPIVDVFAPGQDVTSAWIGSDTATNNISGTSMATPHVAGLIAYLISKEGDASPAQMQQKIKDLAVKDKLANIPSGTSNNLIQIGPL